MARTLLFTYGLLQPGWSPPATMSRSWQDAVRGDLYDLGPYPGALAVGVSDRWIEGHVVEIEETELLALDHFEGVDEGQYVRLRTTARGGAIVWVYEYRSVMPVDAQLIDKWDVARRGSQHRYGAGPPASLEGQ